jgi:hypothetical protein
VGTTIVSFTVRDAEGARSAVMCPHLLRYREEEAQLQLVFLDDSEQSDPPRRGLGPLLAVGCVLVPERAVAGYAADLAAVRTELGMPPGEEIKWKPAKNSFLASAGGQLVTTLRTTMLETAISWDIRSAVVVWDHGAAWRDRPKQEVGREILKYLYERISMCLSDHDDIGVVIADKPGGGSAQETHWLAATLELTNAGTEYVAPDRVVLPIVTAPSHHVPHLQLADLVTAATTAAVAGRLAGLQLRDLLCQLAHKHALGYAGGAGIVLWPRQPNLFYWAFGETAWMLPSKLAGYELPNLDWAYGTDDGLAEVVAGG